MTQVDRDSNVLPRFENDMAMDEYDMQETLFICFEFPGDTKAFIAFCKKLVFSPNGDRGFNFKKGEFIKVGTHETLAVEFEGSLFKSF